MSEQLSGSPEFQQQEELARLKKEAANLCEVARVVLDPSKKALKLFLQENNILPTDGTEEALDEEAMLAQVFRVFPAARNFLGNDLAWHQGQLEALRNPSQFRFSL